MKRIRSQIPAARSFAAPLVLLLFVCSSRSIAAADAEGPPPKELTSLELIERLYHCSEMPPEELIEYEKCLPEYEKFYLLGWSPKGRLAYLLEHNTGEAGGYSAELIVRDFQKSNALESLRFSSEATPKVFSMDDLWRYHGAGIGKTLAKYGIAQKSQWTFEPADELKTPPVSIEFTKPQPADDLKPNCLKVNRKEKTLYKVCKQGLIGVQILGVIKGDALPYSVVLFYENSSGIEDARPARLHVVGIAT